MVTEITPNNFDKEIKQHKGQVIVDFWAPWCMPCRMMAPVFEEVSKEYKGKLKFVKLNTEEHPELASDFDISGIPCLVILKDSKEIGRLVGFRQEDGLREGIDNIL